MLTKEEAEAVARAERERNEADARPSDPNRRGPAAKGKLAGTTGLLRSRIFGAGEIATSWTQIALSTASMSKRRDCPADRVGATC